MKICILSDSHDHIPLLDAAVGEARAAGAETVLHCGDVVAPSTLECLEGLRDADGGELRVAGVDPAQEPRQLRDVIGVQLQSAGLPDTITPEEAMQLFCAYHRVPPRFAEGRNPGFSGDSRGFHEGPPPGYRGGISS